MFSARWAQIILFEKKMGFEMKNKSLLDDALTHPSFCKSRFEMLEFIGDRVVGLAASKFLWMPRNEKEYAIDLISLTNKSCLIEIAKLIQLEQHVRWRGIKSHKDTIMADAVEALMGAIFLDLGFETAFKFIVTKWKENLKKNKLSGLDPKSCVQIWSDKNGISISYNLFKEVGPAHDKNYSVQLVVNGKNKFYGEGKSIKLAEKDAAEKFLRELEK